MYDRPQALLHATALQQQLLYLLSAQELMEAYRLASNTSAAEGCLQTIHQSMDMIERHLSYFRSLCQGDSNAKA